MPSTLQEHGPGAVDPLRIEVAAAGNRLARVTPHHDRAARRGLGCRDLGLRPQADTPRSQLRSSQSSGSMHRLGPNVRRLILARLGSAQARITSIAIWDDCGRRSVGGRKRDPVAPPTGVVRKRPAVARWAQIPMPRTTLPRPSWAWTPGEHPARHRRPPGPRSGPTWDCLSHSRAGRRYWLRGRYYAGNLSRRTRPLPRS